MPKDTVGRKVHVKSFDAVIIDEEDGRYGNLVVKDESGMIHTIYPNQVEPGLPYEDGKRYIDAYKRMFVFGSHAYGGDPGWVSEPGEFAYPLSRPVRPLCKIEIGDAIEE